MINKDKDNTHQFLATIKAVKTVALKAETFSECNQLAVWFLANVPYVEPVKREFILIRALSDLCHMWVEVGCVEDELLPALSIAYTLAAHGYMTREDLDLLADRQSRFDWMVSNPNFNEDFTTYEDFCDKYAEHLNA